MSWGKNTEMNWKLWYWTKSIEPREDMGGRWKTLRLSAELDHEPCKLEWHKNSCRARIPNSRLARGNDTYYWLEVCFISGYEPQVKVTGNNRPCVDFMKSEIGFCMEILKTSLRLTRTTVRHIQTPGCSAAFELGQEHVMSQWKVTQYSWRIVGL